MNLEVMQYEALEIFPKNDIVHQQFSFFMNGIADVRSIIPENARVAPTCSSCSESSAATDELTWVRSSMVMVPEDWRALLENTLEQVRSGEIEQARVDDAVRRILRVKMRAGLFIKGRPSSRPLAGNASLIGAPEHRRLARQAVRQSLVLLKNTDGLLPLQRNAHVLVAGDGADRDLRAGVAADDLDRLVGLHDLMATLADITEARLTAAQLRTPSVFDRY